MVFLPEMVPPIKNNVPAFWFIFYNDKLLVSIGNTVTIPFFTELPLSNIEPSRKQYLGKLNNHPCYTAEVFTDEFVPKNMSLLGLRQLFGLINENLFWVAGRAIQVVKWDRTHQFCGQCGSRSQAKLNEYAKVCPNCGLISYPRISPAVIVAITKDSHILLARSHHFKSKFYSVISGFVEPGETLEECLRREVKEEVGIEIKNISYFGSQSWPFPGTLMIAYTAEYHRGEIIIDEEEIEDARWFTVENLPDLPNPISIACHLINWFVEKQK